MTTIDRSLGVVLIGIFLAGCGATQDPAQDGMSHIRVLTALHTRVSSELGRPPKDEAEFKSALQKSGVSLDALEVDSLDELFVSERDGQPLVVVYGKMPPGTTVVVYEQTGVDGKRQVGHKIGMVEEVDDAKFKELVPASAKK